jgi:hypothetical protein
LERLQVTWPHWLLPRRELFRTENGKSSKYKSHALLQQRKCSFYSFSENFKITVHGFKFRELILTFQGFLVLHFTFL